MAAYLIVQIKVIDPNKYADYRREVPAVIQQYGGRYLVRGGEVEALEGKYDGQRVVVLEFPTAEAARRFWNSPEYEVVKKFREGAATMDSWLVPGIE